MTSQGVDGTVDKDGRIWPDSNQRVKAVNTCRDYHHPGIRKTEELNEIITITQIFKCVYGAQISGKV